MSELLNSCKVKTEFKLKHHGRELDEQIWRKTTSAHNQLVSYLIAKLEWMESRIKELENKK